MPDISRDISALMIRSDFILSKIRQLHDVSCEIFVKWMAGGAFDGAAFARPQSEFLLEVYFNHAAKRKLTTGHGDYVVCELPGMSVTILGEHLHAETEKGICEADLWISSWMGAQQSQLALRVQRLQLSLMYRVGDKDPEVFGRELVGQCFAPFTGEIIVTPARPFPIFQSEMNECWEVDGEVYFSEAEDEADVIRKLRFCLPQIRRPIHGVGFNGKECIRPEVMWAHVSGRYF